MFISYHDNADGHNVLRMENMERSIRKIRVENIHSCPMRYLAPKGFVSDADGLMLRSTVPPCIIVYLDILLFVRKRLNC